MTDKKSKKKSDGVFWDNHSVYSDIIEELNAPVCFLDPKGIFLLSNPACEELFGVNKGKLKGKNLKDFVCPEVFKKVKKWIKKKEYLAELEISKNKGGNKNLHVMISSKHDKKGKHIGSLVLFEDISVRKKFEYKLEEQIDKLQKELVLKNNLFSSLLHKTPDHIYFKDRKSRFVQVSKAFVEDLGVENASEVIGKTDFEFFTKAHAEQAYREEQKMIKTKKPVIGKIIEEAYLNGETVWVSTTKVPWYDEKGNVIGVLGVSRNITETKKLEEKLKKRLAELGEEVVFKSNLLSSLLDNTPDNIYFKDEKSRFVAVSKSQAEWLGAKKTEELIGKTDYDYFTKEHAEQAFLDEQKIIKTGKPIKGKVEKETHPDGRVTWVSTTKIPRYDEEGKIIGTLGISRDVTQQKEIEAEQTLRESEEKYRILVENSQEGIYISRDDKFLFVNDYLCNILGCTKDELYKRKVWEIISEDDRSIFKEMKRRREKGESAPGVYEANIITKNRGIRFCEFFISKITYQGTESFMGIIRDITEYKDMEREREKADRLESLGILAGGIAHDFNNFLTGILGNISLAKLQLDPQSEIYKILEESEEAAQSARSLTQQLLTFSKGGRPVKVNMDVEHLVRSSSNFVLSGSNVRCNFEFPENLWNIEADKGQLAQVFNNLILNADQAMPEGGFIKISAENLELKEVKNLPLLTGRYVKIEITDRGIGIPEDVLSKIFDPFFTTKQKGSGLGLSAVFSIIKRHEGYITVQSEQGKGTSFYVYLPAVDKNKVMLEEGKEIPKGKSKILIMDDKSFVRNAAMKALKLFGYEVEGVANGEEVLTLYKREMDKGDPFDLVILDLTIPGGMGGEDTLKQLRKINPEVKAIVSSGYSDAPVMAEYKKHGFNAVVRKPYRYEELCEIVNEVIKERE